MKKILYLTIALLLATACDKIPADERRTPTEGLPDWNGQYVLLQDFTGVQCIFCPASTREIKRLQTIFGDKLIVVKLHPQTIQNNVYGPLSDTNVDLRNVQAQEYFLHYNIPSLPKGIIMQKSEPLEREQFFGKILSYYTRQAVASIELTANLTGNTININSNVSFIENHNGNGNTHLSLMILEDHLFATQLEAGPPTIIHINYRHDNILRGMATPLWGDQIAGNTITNGTSINRNHTIELNSAWKPENLCVVAILFDNGTKEVIQVAKIKL
jgi:hypothetical protein